MPQPGNLHLKIQVSGEVGDTLELWLAGTSPALKIKQSFGTSLVVQWLDVCLAMQGMQVQSLVRVQRSHIPRGTKPICHN